MATGEPRSLQSRTWSCSGLRRGVSHVVKVAAGVKMETEQEIEQRAESMEAYMLKQQILDTQLIIFL